MTAHYRLLRCLALPAIALASASAVAAAAAPPAPTLQQAQAAMDRLFDQAIAERPASASSQLVAEAFRPRLLALSGCIAPADAGLQTIDCIATAQAGPEPVHRLLRFTHADGQWSLLLAREQRNLPVPVPPVARVQVLLRESFAAQRAAEKDPQARAALEQSMRTATVLGVEQCEVGDAAPVIECRVSATAGDERGDLTMAFTWVDGQWQNAGH